MSLKSHELTYTEAGEKWPTKSTYKDYNKPKCYKSKTKQKSKLLQMIIKAAKWSTAVQKHIVLKEEGSQTWVLILTLFIIELYHNTALLLVL